jgi:hypothetical protein
MSDVAEWKRTTLLPLLYWKLARSFCDLLPCPRITSFTLGFGYVDESGETPTFQLIPDDLDAIPGAFFQGTPEPAASEGRALFSCAVPAGSVAAPTRCSMIGLFDQDGDLVAVGQFLPDWINPDESNTYRPFIDFPTTGG